MPENTPKNNIDNAVEKMPPLNRPEEHFGKLDSAARENLNQYGEKPKEFEKLSQEVNQFADKGDSAAPPVRNDNLDKFYNDIDEKKRGDIQKLINIVFEKGPEEGVLAARALDDPYIQDEFEKLLTTDWMHKILVERGLLNDPK